MRFFLLFVLIANLSFGQTRVLVLGTAQDGGFPHIGCQNECQKAYANESLARYVVSLALIDEKNKKWWLFEATPDFTKQLQLFQELTEGSFNYLPEGIFITHAHMGHYTGLMHLGREALGAKAVKVYALASFNRYLKENGPWSQLVQLKNIEPIDLGKNQAVELSNALNVRAFQVPHRDEFSETAGFSIQADQQSYLFIPDIDKWSKWERDIVEEVKKVDVAFLDASFFADGELPNRSIEEVPHPFVIETMNLFQSENSVTKSKVHFIHFNHTNPILFDEAIRKHVREKGFKLAEQGISY